MKKRIEYNVYGKKISREYTYIPVRYIWAAFVTLLEILLIIASVVALCYYVPYFYLAALVTQVMCVIALVSSDDNPDYKVPWLLIVMLIPIAGFMLYFLFYSRTLSKNYVKRLEEIKQRKYTDGTDFIFRRLKEENIEAGNQAQMLCKIADTHVYPEKELTYYPSGEALFAAMLEDLKKAEKFIFMEYFIIEQGKFWDPILEVLKEKAAQGIEVRVVYDDIGCMFTLPGNYWKTLQKMGINAVPFSRMKGAADGEFNNRSHRKITVVDGLVAYTGGVNIADEYINEIERFGHWKDVGLRLTGGAVCELTRLFLIDHGVNVKKDSPWKEEYFPQIAEESAEGKGYLIPFGDGPKPLYERRVGKGVIRNLIAGAKKYVYITTPYLILDDEMCQTIESAALRGVSVKLILPHIPDKKLVFEASKSFYKRLMEAGAEIYEYEPGFIHAKVYLIDGEYAMVGTINLDHRSLVHHFENGVWMYRCGCIADIERDFNETAAKSIAVEKSALRVNIFKRALRSVIRIFATLL
ncbi:MAG: cardiolipin synthase [Clostridia bacterium]|nr:cardiolipin synthase [Clostridia bacterium]